MQAGEPTANTFRVATFNTALSRPKAGQLASELATGRLEAAQQIAAVVQHVRPDVILLNEVDYDELHSCRRELQEKYLEVGQGKQQGISYPFHFTAPVNTGVPTAFDLNGDGQTHGPADAYGYGKFPGQYGMIVLSRYPIDTARIRTFQHFLWKDMPQALAPVDPQSGARFYADPVWTELRLSSKSHWDVPIRVDSQTIHFLVSHPTPPAFDGPEDRNGARNHDEIRFWADYVDANRSGYIYDDQGQRGGLAPDARFVIAGDLNADPFDGDSRDSAIQLLLRHPRINGDLLPRSSGGVAKSALDAKANLQHRGDAACDTSDFSDSRTGNLRVDYVLPSQNLSVTGCGVFWPAPEEEGSQWVVASDHRLVWIDIERK